MAANGMRRLRVFLVAAATVVLSGCSVDVVGNVFVKVGSGDIKRGADVEIVLVNASAQFDAELKKAVEAYKSVDLAQYQVRCS